jgi:alpha-tubulin suppressor-like RCC1 family protein
MPLSCHTLLLSLEGALLAFGWNSQGQLGLGHNNEQLTPATVPWKGPQPVQVDWGLEHSLVLDVEGGVWQAGSSRFSASPLTFERVPEVPPMILVAAGNTHSVALDTEGGLWAWTCKEDLSWARSLPQRVEGLPPLLKVACGEDFLVAETEEGLWVLGENSSGQLGLGHTNSASGPTCVQVKDLSEGPLRCLVALNDGVMIVDSQGGVFSSGYNSDGQLGRSIGDDKKLQRIKNIPPMLGVSCGFDHTLALDESGGVWTWGHGYSGQLGTGNTSSQHQPALVPSLKGMSALLAGGNHSLAFLQEGGLLVFGFNHLGQLGLEHTTNLPTPTLCPVQPALPHSFTSRSRKKSARFL